MLARCNELTEGASVKRGGAHAAAFVCLMLVGSCGQRMVVGGPGGGRPKLSHPGLATSQAVFLKVYRATPDGLLVSGLFPDAHVDPDRDPGTVLHGLSFTADPSVHGSFFWKFADGITFLDGTCQKTDRPGLIAAATRAGAISVQFMTFLYADQRPWAPPALHVFSRALDEPTNCTDTILADPSFAP